MFQYCLLFKKEEHRTQTETVALQFYLAEYTYSLLVCLFGGCLYIKNSTTVCLLELQTQKGRRWLGRAGPQFSSVPASF